MKELVSLFFPHSHPFDGVFRWLQTTAPPCKFFISLVASALENAHERAAEMASDRQPQPYIADTTAFVVTTGICHVWWWCSMQIDHSTESTSILRPSQFVSRGYFAYICVTLNKRFTSASSNKNMHPIFVFCFSQYVFRWQPGNGFNTSAGTCMAFVDGDEVKIRSSPKYTIYNEFFKLFRWKFLPQCYFLTSSNYFHSLCLKAM